MNSTLDITTTSTEVIPTEEVEIVTALKPITDSQLQEYAKATGQKLVKLKGLRQKALLGDLIERFGASKHGVALLLESCEDVADIMALAKDIIQTFPAEYEAQVGAVKALTSLVELKTKAAHALIKSKRDSAVEDSNMKPQRQPPPPPPALNVLIQNNPVGSGS
jgi:hypothetical protein